MKILSFFYMFSLSATSRFKGLFFLLLFFLAGPLQPVASPSILPEDRVQGAGRLRAVGEVFVAALNEVSGMAKSRLHERYVWAHNDSGGAARVFGFEIAPEGQLQWGQRYQQFFLPDEENYDWEDLFVGTDGAIYIADTGNNLKLRETGIFYRVQEPHALPYAQGLNAEEIRFRYGSTGFDKENAAQVIRRDCEAVCEFDGGILLFTKSLLNANCDVFYIADVVGTEVGDKPLTAEFCFRISNLRGVTAADSWVDPSTGCVSKIAVLSYGMLWVWDMDETDGVSALAQRIDDGSGLRIRAGLCESLMFESEHTLIIGNEGRELFRVTTNGNTFGHYPP